VILMVGASSGAVLGLCGRNGFPDPLRDLSGSELLRHLRQTSVAKRFRSVARCCGFAVETGFPIRYAVGAVAGREEASKRCMF
jgi:hypothetical protein